MVNDKFENVTTPLVVLKATTLRFPTGKEYVVQVLPGNAETYKKYGDVRDKSQLPWQPVTREGRNGFRLDRGFWYIRILQVPMNPETKKPDLYIGAVNSLPSIWTSPNPYYDSDPWPPPIDVNGNNPYTVDYPPAT